MGNAMFRYSSDFYKYIEGIKADEKIIMPFVMEKLSPASVVDFGCGEGVWLKEAMRLDEKLKF